jgi:RimJ/RimL family protein N-acetyltransferase
MEIPTITTPRLTLRAWRDDDVDPLFRVMDDREVMRYFPNTDPPSRERVEQMISRQKDHWGEHGFGWWAIELRATGALIGWSGLQFLPETDETEVAYLVAKPHWGKGLATEAASAGLQYGFEQLELECIIGLVHLENAASQRVIQKLGMSFVDQAYYFGIDVFRYALKRSSFISRV